MPTAIDDISQSPLFEEHCLLGGVFGDQDSLLAAPLHYGEPKLLEAFTDGCALCDLSGMTGILLSGNGVDAFVNTACSCQPLQVGECTFGAVVTGDGSITAIPLVARTGTEEYLVWDASDRGLALQPWLGFLSDIEQRGFRPFDGVTVEDVSDSLVPLMLWGHQATAILADYVPSTNVLPAPGIVASINLDRIPCLVARLPLGGECCYLVLVPPKAARVLWRSLLSFSAVTPVGSSQLTLHATSILPWLGYVLQPSKLSVALRQLVAWGLARPEGGYVGHRALQDLDA